MVSRMARQKFDLAALMGAEAVSNLDTMQVQEIALDQIDENPANTYSQQGIDDLAESIQVVGLQQPLVVQPNGGGRYLLIAGHRRRNALALLGRTSAPCIVSPEGLDPAKRTLILHWTNTMARGGAGLTGDGLASAAKEIEAALLDLKKRGEVELPGKLREYVAGVLQVSESNLARAKAIDSHLSNAWKGDYKCRRINESVAYELSTCDEHLQVKLHGAYKGKEYQLDAKKVKAHKKSFAAAKAPLTCPEESYRVEPCVGTDKRAAAVARGECPGCCHACAKSDGCDWVCGKVSKRNRAHAEAEERKQRNQEQEDAFRASEAGKAYIHARETLERFGYDRDNLPQIDGITWSLKYLFNTELSQSSMPSLKMLSETAAAIGISLQELLFGNSTPEGQALAALDAGLKSAIQAEPIWHSYPAERPAEGQTVLTCKFNRSSGGYNYSALIYRPDGWYLPEMPDFEMSVDVRWWSVALAPAEEGEKS